MGSKTRYELARIALFRTAVLKHCLSGLKIGRIKKEYFLTDVIEILYLKGSPAEAVCLDDASQILGVNTLKDLVSCEKVMKKRIIDGLYSQGVKVMSPETAFIEKGVKIGKNTLIYPFTCIEKDVIIGNTCSAGPFIHIGKGGRIGRKAVTGAGSVVTRNVKAKTVVIGIPAKELKRKR